MWIFVNDSLFITNSCLEKKKRKEKSCMTNVCLPGQRWVSKESSGKFLLTACKNQNPDLGSLWGTPCPLAVNFRKGHHGLLLRNPAAKSRRGREKRWGEKGFDSGNYDLLTSFFTPLIICLTVDTTLIIDGQVGPAKNRAAAGICGCGIARLRVFGSSLCFPCSPGSSSRASSALCECFSNAKWERVLYILTKFSLNLNKQSRIRGSENKTAAFFLED